MSLIELVVVLNESPSLSSVVLGAASPNANPIRKVEFER
jgi:hypothetical protein